MSAKRVPSRSPPTSSSTRSPKKPKSTTSSRPRLPVSFDEFPNDDIFTLDVCGDEGLGKTHFACTFPKPLIIGDTEYKAYTTASKFEGVLWKRVGTFDDFRQIVYHAIDNDDIRTVVIDSGGDLVQLAGLEWNSETGKNYRFPISNYGNAYDKIDELVLELEEARKYFVSTSRLKDEWIQDVSTGRRIRDRFGDEIMSLNILHYPNPPRIQKIPVGSIICREAPEGDTGQPRKAVLPRANLRHSDEEQLPWIRPRDRAPPRKTIPLCNELRWGYGGAEGAVGNGVSNRKVSGHLRGTGKGMDYTDTTRPTAIEGGNHVKMCPFKYDHSVDFDQWICEEQGCALWDSRMRACGLFSIMVMMKAIAGNLRDVNKDDVEKEIDEWKR